MKEGGPGPDRVGSAGAVSGFAETLLTNRWISPFRFGMIAATVL
jgi:hypothetical protein